MAEQDKITEVSVPGAGNMNFVVRLQTNHGSVILKQSKAYVEKYPQIDAPASRVLTEAAFYKTIQSHAPTAQWMPRIILVDQPNNQLILEDLGTSKDYSFLYQEHRDLSLEEINSLCDYLSALHHNFQSATPIAPFQNLEMRRLNHQHLFVYPFMEDNGLDLDSIQPGLQGVALPYQKDLNLKKRITDLGENYLSDGSYLLHGDFYPGSWLKTSQGLRIIDPEFCFYGPVEFDLGVFIAHLYMTQQSQSVIDKVIENYRLPVEKALLNQYTGVEIMRRLIGLAQLPLILSVEQKTKLLSFARELVMDR